MRIGSVTMLRHSAQNSALEADELVHYVYPQNRDSRVEQKPESIFEDEEVKGRRTTDVERKPTY